MLKKCLLLLSISGFSFAQSAPSPLEEGFKKLAPTAKISTIQQTPINGISEITLKDASVEDIYYMTNDGKYFIKGNIIETSSKSNITENRKNSLRKKIVDEARKNKSIDFFPKDMKHHVTVYTDIDCGYCRKLHNEMKNFNDLGIGISYVFWPRAGLNSSSYDKAVTAWCAVDRQDAMTKSQNGEILEPKQCDNPVREHFISGQKIGVNGTPNIVTDKGLLIPTYLPAQVLYQRLEALASAP
ncbi:MAG: thioredoxin fold domain-containing protein [Alcanivoracaceae bacterium]|nr:thioredoxin fold domain-containing protein [Alcanivoracaceae bacterium]